MFADFSKDWGCDLSHLGPCALVPFSARKLREARIAWINRRWWTSKGVDISCPDKEGALAKWLLDNYAFLVPTADNAPWLDDECQTFSADRYGAPGGAFVGGSGRCGVRGGLNIKGVGRTPLAGSPKRLDWIHTNGFVWLDEAIREVVMAEITASEFPEGGVAPVAIIQTGIPASASSGKETAIIVRPNFVRLAHFERSIFFGGAGTATSDQYLDACRTRDAWRAIGDDMTRQQLGVSSSAVGQGVKRYYRQLSFSHIHRIYIGGVSTSNVSLDGEIVDFGGYTSIATWNRTHVQSLLPPFGDDMESVANMVQSLDFYRRKYQWGALQSQDVIAQIMQSHDLLLKGFREHVCTALGMDAGRKDEAADRIVSVLYNYFRLQQAKSVHVRDRRRLDWIYSSLTMSSIRNTEKSEHDRAAANLFDAIVEYHSTSERPTTIKSMWESARRLFAPRLGLDWDLLTRKIAWLLKTGSTRDRVETFINAALSRSRRVWPGLPPGIVLLAQACDTGSCLLYGYDTIAGKYVLLAKGPADESGITLLGRRYSSNVIGRTEGGRFLFVRPECMGISADDVLATARAAGIRFYRYSLDSGLALHAGAS